MLMEMTDRQVAKVEPGQQSQITIDRKNGRPLTGKVKGLEDVQLDLYRT